MTADLTRWNRAGLRRFRYVDGNAAVYLEQIREALALRFAKWADERLHLPDVVIEREITDRLAWRDRVLEQYQGERRDWAWELARTFARACHVLTGHIDAFANEGFLETATQWDLLRRLVEMLGYSPAPPSSAATPLVLTVKPGASGKVKAGLPVKHSPPSGAPPVVFETLDELAVDHGLNELRLARWNRSEQTFQPFDGGKDPAASPWHRAEEMAISVGQLGLVLQLPEAGITTVRPDARVVEVRAVQEGAGGVAVDDPASGKDRSVPAGDHWQRGYTRLLVSPAKVHRPHLNGPGLARLDRPHGLAGGDVVAWHDENAWVFNVVRAADETAITVVDPAKVPRGKLHKAAPVHPVGHPTRGPELRVPLNLAVAAHRNAGGLVVLARNQFKLASAAPEDQGFLIPSAPLTATELYVITAAAPAVGEVVPAADAVNSYGFDGGPGGLASGAWVVAEYQGATPVRRAARVARVDERDDGFRLVLEDPAQVFAASVPDDVLQRLIAQLRRIEALLDQTAFDRLRLDQLTTGAVTGLSTDVIEGIGRRNANPPSYADKLAGAGITSVRDLARLRATTPVGGVSTVWLREFRTRAEQLLKFPEEVTPVTALLGTRLAAILAMEKDAPPSTLPDLPLERLYGPFKHTLHPLGHDRNQVEIGPAPHQLSLPAAELPPALKAGRLVLVEQEVEGGLGIAREAIITKVDGNTIELAPPLREADQFTLGNTIIRANVARAGHGEAKAERLLGSGNAAQLNQEFVMDVAGVSFVADSTMPSGVRADIAVSVDGQIWYQVATLRDSGRTDPHYTVRMTEEGFLRIGFGDGENGRRLPTGANNVRARYRVGSGLAGNLPAGSLEKLVTPHALVARARQPLPAVGGNDLETVASLRETAPTSVLALERAVSLSDFESLGASQSGVWQARAFRRTASLGREENLDVVIVPAGGAPLDAQLQAIVTPDFLNQQRDFLLRHTTPGIDLTVRAFQPVLFDLHVTVRVKSAEFDPALVVERVRAGLRAAFELRRRRLGQPLQVSEVYRVVEEISGVENSDCEISLLAAAGMATRPRRVVTQLVHGREVARTILAHERQVIYLDPERSTVKVVAEEFEL